MIGKESLLDLGFIVTVPNVVFEWLTLLLRIRQGPGSNICHQIGYAD
jgi:hypothetical protein